MRHAGVRAATAQASDAELERALSAVHEPGYLRALAQVQASEPVLMADFAAPGMAARHACVR